MGTKYEPLNFDETAEESSILDVFDFDEEKELMTLVDQAIANSEMTRRNDLDFEIEEEHPARENFVTSLFARSRNGLPMR